MFRRSALALLLLTAAPAFADYGAGMGAYSRKDFPTARTAFLQVAQLADVGAQRALASMYARGEGGTVDLVEAYAWASLATDQGDVAAGKIRDAISAGLPAALKPQAEARVLDYRGKYSLDAVKRQLYPVSTSTEPSVFDLQVPAASVRKQFPVEYPERAKEKNEQGYACVSFFVDKAGKALDIRRYDNKGSSALAAAAEKSLSNWTFEPVANEQRVGHCVEFLIEDDKTWRSIDQLKALQSKARKGDSRSQLEYAREVSAAQHAVTGRVEVHAVTDAWLQAALTGAAEAQFEMASRLLRGDGCVADKEKALHWLQLALAQNHAPAQQYVALYLASEKALAVTAAQRSEWLQAAAAGGSFEAQLRAAKEQLHPGANQNASAALTVLTQLDAERHLHVRDWRAYAHALLGDFDSALSEAEDALELATDIGLATELRQTVVNVLEKEQPSPVPAY